MKKTLNASPIIAAIVVAVLLIGAAFAAVSLLSGNANVTVTEKSYEFKPPTISANNGSVSGTSWTGATLQIQQGQAEALLVTFTITNNDSKPLAVSPSVTCPAGLTYDVSPASLNLPAGETATIAISITASDTIVPGDYNVSVNF